jgi:hypothetical protein
MSSKHPTCGTCPHMVLADVGRGECHLDPPQTFILHSPQGVQFVGLWRPVGTDTEGCSHHPRWPEYVGRFERTLTRERESEGQANGVTGPKLIV